MKPTPAKPRIIIAQVEGSGTGGAAAAKVKSASILSVDVLPSGFVHLLPSYHPSPTSTKWMSETVTPLRVNGPRLLSNAWLMLNTLSGAGLVVCWMFRLNTCASNALFGEVKFSEKVYLTLKFWSVL